MSPDLHRPPAGYERAYLGKTTYPHNLFKLLHDEAGEGRGSTSTVRELKQILGDLHEGYGPEISAIVSRSGIPIAWNVPEDIHIENFATLSATLLGASEVVYTGLKKAPPNRVVVESTDGTLVAVGLGSKALLVALSSGDQEKLLEGVLEASRKIVNVLREEGRR